MFQDLNVASNEEGMYVHDCWQNFNIRRGLDNIAVAGEEVSPSTMNALWQKLWMEVIYNFTGFAVPQKGDLAMEIDDLENKAQMGVHTMYS